MLNGPAFEPIETFYRDTNGTLPKVPGYPPGTTLKYRVGAQKTGDSSGKTAHFWLKLFNPNAFEVRVVVCAMLTLKKPPVPNGSRAFTVVKNTAAQWECQSTGILSAPKRSLQLQQGNGPSEWYHRCFRPGSNLQPVI